MDNLTHTIIGMIAGEATARCSTDHGAGLSARTRRVLLIAVTAIASNLPDLDLLVSYRGFTRAKLDYMLGHRGYTHTVIGCLLLAAALLGALELWMRWRALRPNLSDRILLASSAVVGTALHLGMDFLNSYGVHPFWPLDNHWHYGDSVFIVEPLYWIAAAPLIFTQNSTVARAFVALAVSAAPILGLVTGLVPAPIVAALVLFAAALLACGAWLSKRAAALVSLAAWAAITGLFVICGKFAARDALAAAKGASVLDHVLTPMPANPVCWDLLLIESAGGPGEAQREYRVRHAVISIAPPFMQAGACPDLSTAASTAPWHAVPLRDTRAIRWIGELTLPLDTFARLADRYCDAAALLRFARAPFAVTGEQGTVIGDLRFDREPGLGFSELLLSGARDRSTACRRTAPWVPPREALLH